jgi:hypothetical protein
VRLRLLVGTADLDARVDLGFGALNVAPGDVPDLDAMITAADTAQTLPEAAEPSGLGAAPRMIWRAALLMGYAVLGPALQSAASLSRVPLSPTLAALSLAAKAKADAITIRVTVKKPDLLAEA